MILISYINARGEEIILDDTERSFIGELYGRKGCEAPSLKYTEILYGDGSTDIVVVNAQPREVTLYFWAPQKTDALRRAFDAVKQKLVQTGTRGGSWGKLKIYQPATGTYMVLNSVYIGGLNDTIRDYPAHVKFALTFRANDPLFYDDFVTRYVIEPDASHGFLYFKDIEFSGDEYDFAEDNITNNPNGLYMRDLTDTDHDDSEHNPNAVYFVSAEVETRKELELLSQKIYPLITISGSAKNVRLVNEYTERKIEFAASVIVDGQHPIVIDTRPLHRKVVQVDTATGIETSLIGKLTADSSLDFFLERGTNVIRFRNSEATPESLCTFEYTEGHLSAE